MKVARKDAESAKERKEESLSWRSFALFAFNYAIETYKPNRLSVHRLRTPRLPTPNFPSDSVLAAKHAEIRVNDDGSVTVADLGQAPAGVFLRVRPQQPVDLQAGDVVRVGQQLLHLEVG